MITTRIVAIALPLFVLAPAALTAQNAGDAPRPESPAAKTPQARIDAAVKVAAQATAATGLSTRVPTTVAMELAESWKPLMKSNAKATRMIAIT